jgi:hypothetical protein
MSAPPSEALGPCEHGDEIDEKSDCGEARKPEVDGHRQRPSRVVAEADIAEARRDQAEDDADPE